MKWTKLGRVFETDKNHPWMLSHAANPVAEHLRDDVFRLYFSCRDHQSRSHISFADIELKPPFKVLSIAEEPLLAPGDIGTFDDSGTSLSCIARINGTKYLYYLGWNLGVTVPWRNSIGLAIYDPATSSFKRFSKAPLLDRHAVDPYSISYPFVMEDHGVYRMWYGSNLKWGGEQKDMAHLIKYAESDDAIHWKREGIIALQFKNDREYAMSRPCVIKEYGIYKMWYSCRGESYRIGYAESDDGIKWVRKDEDVGIDVSASGWDSQMIEYPFVFDHKGQRYMLYNGNDYGKTGIGLAVLDRERSESHPQITQEERANKIDLCNVRMDRDWLRNVLESVSTLGYAVVEGVLSTSFLESTRAAMYRTHEKILRELGKGRLERAGEIGVLRLMMKYDPHFFQFLEIPEVLEIVDNTVSPTAIMHLQNGFILPSSPKEQTPSVFQNRFHQDFPRVLNGYVASINVMFAIDEFSIETGATHVVPRTHQLMTPPDEKYLAQNAIAVECPAGSMLVFDSTLWHAAGANTSGKDRLAINHQFTRSYIKQQIDYVRALGDATVLAQKPRTQQLLGWYTRVVTSLDEYYRPENERLYRKGQG